MHKGLTGIRAMGAEGGVPYFMGQLANVYGKAKQPEEGLGVLAEALAIVEQTGERYHEAELHRLQGELLLKSEGKRGKDETADDLPEICFLRAIEVAQRQRAKWHELRATVSLSQLWQQQGRTLEARQMLSEIYDWFAEGFDTRHLIEAKVLLDKLSVAD
jgi:predicted ATPase